MTYLRPGVYVEESLNLTAPVVGPDSTSVAAFVGVTDKGPTEPTLVTSWSQYTKLFGSWGTNNTLTTAVYLFFTNGGSRAYILRVAGDGAASATRTFLDSNSEDPLNTLTLSAKNHGAWGNSIYITISNTGSGTFDVIVYQGGTGTGNVVERFTDLSMDATNSRYAVSVINGASAFVTAIDENSTSLGSAINPATASLQPLAGGTDGDPVTDSDLVNAIDSLDVVTNSLVLNVPGVTGATQINALITYIEGRGDVFLVIDGINDTVSAQLSLAESYSSTSLAGVYYPNLTIPNPLSSSPGSTVVAPVGASIVGKIISTDASRGVFKAPAGLTTRISGAVSVPKLTNNDLDLLNSSVPPVNAVRFIPGSGIVVMGARTLASGYIDKYIPVRRTLIYLRKALTDLTEFAVFEPNDFRLWRQINARVESFLTDFWSQGGLRGATPQQAFFVKCDEETNPLEKVDAGEVNLEVGVALQRPAEFVIIKIGQYDGGATVTVA